MTSDDRTESSVKRGPPDPELHAEAASARPWANLPWLLRQKVLLPEPVAGYMERPALAARCEALNYRLTMLVAPAGFGKTAVLAQSCRRLRERGIAVAWLSPDEEDGPDALVTYLAFAFEQAGLAVFDQPGAGDEAGHATGPEGATDTQAGYRINLLIAAVERYHAPCLLALDELERLTSPGAVEALNMLLRRAPPNLHFAMAYRERPAGLDIAMFLLEGNGTTIAVEDLRFSKPEITAFFDTWLPRRELDAVAERSAGWPMALRIHRNAKDEGMPAEIDGDTVAAWIETRLWRGMSDTERDFVLDLALFDWFDAELLEEATGVRGAAQRIESMRSLTGLLQTTGAGAPKMRLHPLIQQYCSGRRANEDPERFRTIHAGIAHGLARRREVVDALRHAVMSNDLRLVGTIAEEAGGLRLAIKQGFEILRAVVGMLSINVFDLYPRLALARCLVLTVRGDVAEAERTYRETAAATSDFTRDREGGDDRALVIDHLLLQGTLRSTGCKFPALLDMSLGADTIGLATATDLEPGLRGMISFGFCAVHNHVADFANAVEWAERARTQLGPKSYLAPYTYYEMGVSAMAQGRPDVAQAYYDRALGLAKRDYLRDSGAVVLGGVLKAELAFERSGFATQIKAAGASPRLLGESGAPLQVYAANFGLAVEAALWTGRPDKALALVEDAREYALRTSRSPLVKFLSALHVSVLLAEHNVGEATRAWAFNDLPEAQDDCLDLARRGWRQTELLTCTRIRLCIARRDYELARSLANQLRRLAVARGLRRTLMRAEALSMVLEYSAGDSDAAVRHLTVFIGLFQETDYAGALVRDREIAVGLLDQLGAIPSARTEKLSMILAPVTPDSAQGIGSTLTDGEMEVLERLAQHQRDRQIAADLALTVDGVRYRIRNIFSKLNARSRFDAVHRARAAGVLPENE